jgi:hypothetical protein
MCHLKTAYELRVEKIYTNVLRYADAYSFWHSAVVSCKFASSVFRRARAALRFFMW